MKIKVLHTTVEYPNSRGLNENNKFHILQLSTLIAGVPMKIKVLHTTVEYPNSRGPYEHKSSTYYS